MFLCQIISHIDSTCSFLLKKSYSVVGMSPNSESVSPHESTVVVCFLCVVVMTFE